MDDQREGHGPGRTGAALKTEKSPKANLRSLAVLFLQLCEFMELGHGGAPGNELLAGARELVRRTQ